MLKKTIKYICVPVFIFILMVKMMIPVNATFISPFSKQIKPITLLADQESEDEKSSDYAIDLLNKSKKIAEVTLTHLYKFAPAIIAVNLRYHQQDALFKQTHILPILTPPPDRV